jgi:ElaB/YqjD/DUF883 family membrane-anchored ribosome-binding protein
MEQSNTIGAGAGSGRGVMERVRETATAQLSNQKERATSSIGSVAQAVRQSAQPLRDNRQDVIAQYVEKAADQLDRFSTRLRDRDVSDIVDDVQRFARQRPALFVGAAFAAGILAARFLKSSADSGRSGQSDWYEPRDSRYATPSFDTRGGL